MENYSDHVDEDDVEVEEKSQELMNEYKLERTMLIELTIITQ